MYGKHFQSMYTGSMVGSGCPVFAVWGFVIANMRPDAKVGAQVELNPILLAVMLGDTVETITAAIDKLSSPDPKSRSKENEGRRLIRLGEYDYQVVNGPKYLAIRNEDERREYNRIRQQSIRSKRLEQNYSAESRVLLNQLVEKTGREYRETATSLAPIDARLKEAGVTVEGCKLMIDRQVARWKGTHMEEYLRPSTLFGKEKFNEYYAAKDAPVVHPTGNGGGNAHVDRGTGTTNEGTASEYRGMGKVVGTPNIPGLGTGNPG